MQYRKPFGLWAFSLLYPALSGYSQNIDAIQTNEQALAFVRKIDPDQRSIYLQPGKIVLDGELDSVITHQYVIRGFEKADIDNNGLTDLLFNGYYCYEENSFCRRIVLVVLSFGNDSFKVESLSRDLSLRTYAAKFVYTKDQTLLQMIWVERSVNPDGALKPGGDTLVYAHHNLIEKRIPSLYQINRISYSFSGGGKSLINDFDIVINPDSSWLDVVYITENLCKKRYRMVPSQKSWEQLKSILNGIDFNSLNDNYEVNASCGATAYLTVEVENGKTKKIADYGLEGTYGLEAIHRLFFGLRDLPSWIIFDEVEAY